MNAAPAGIAVKNRAHPTLKEAVWKEEPAKSAARLTNAGTGGCGLVNGAANWFLTNKLIWSADFNTAQNYAGGQSPLSSAFFDGGKTNAEN